MLVERVGAVAGDAEAVEDGDAEGSDEHRVSRFHDRHACRLAPSRERRYPKSITRLTSCLRTISVD